MYGPLYPKFRKSSTGELLLTDSAEGRRAAAERPAWSPPLSAAVIDKEARERVKSRRGDLSDEKDVLGEYILQSGKYRGKSFRWLLENVPGYVGWFIGKIVDEGKDDTSNLHQKNNKTSFKRYVEMFEEGRSIIQRKQDEKAGKVTPGSVSKFKNLLVGRQLPPHVLTHRVKGLISPGKFKPNIPSTSRAEEVHVVPLRTAQVEEVVLPTAQAAETFTRGGETPEDLELVEFLEEIESTETSGPLLYQGWKASLPKVDHQWVSKTFFRRNPVTNRIEFRSERLSQLWHSPPPPSFSPSVRNRVDRYFAHRLFLWMPVNMWGVRLLCPHSDENGECRGVLTRAGIHQKTRTVLDVDCHYVIAAEYLACSSCGRKVLPWAHNVLSQLDNDHQMLFPCILTAKLACDKKVVALLRNRGLGNSSSKVCRQLEEEHGDRYLRQCHHYLTECRKFRSAAQTGLIVQPQFEDPSEIIPIPRHRWLMKVYQLDVLQRLDYIKATITSQFGSVLKIDSTKKITKKLGGRSTKTAMWATNVGNEHGQILMSVLTVGEGVGLRAMIDGIISRYRDSKVDPPCLLYVDRDCCGGSAISRYFQDWPLLRIRLDIWHFMRRLSQGCTTDAHPLYGVFLGRLSHCIFRWEEDDVSLLKRAKRSEMAKKHISTASDRDVMRAITSNELALHCRRVTRGAEETRGLISDLIQSMDGDRGLDILGVPLMDTLKMQEIWIQQSRHVGCIQDPEGVQLYTRVGTLRKGGVELPTYRCARGSTSLESFHLHMARFIPGTLASDVNFQVYLVDGVYRWNEDRKRDATTLKDAGVPLSYDGPLQQAVKTLAAEVLGKEMCRQYIPPKKYTGELIGLEYLFSQSTGGAHMNYRQAAEALEEGTAPDGGEEEEDDEGFVEPVEDVTVPLLDVQVSATSTPPQPSTPPLTTLAPIPDPLTAAKYVPLKTPSPFLHIPTDEEYRSLNPGSVQALPGEMRTPSDASAISTATEEVPNPVVEQPAAVDDSDVGPNNIPGYKQVLELAAFLVRIRDQPTPLTTDQANEVIQRWNCLSDYDKQRTKFPARFATSSRSGRFKSPKKQVALGVASIERAVLGPNATRANWPDCNRYVEVIVQDLVKEYPSDRRSTKTKSFTSRWTMIKEGYSRIQGLVLGNQRIMAETELQLPSLNVKTIQQWYNKKGKQKDLQILLQGINLPEASMTGTGAPPPKQKPRSLTVGEGARYAFPDAPDTTGMAKLKRPRTSTSAPAIHPRPLQTAPTIFPRHIQSSPTIFPGPPPMFAPIILSPQGTVVTVQPQQAIPPVGVPVHFEAAKPKYRRTTVRCPKCGEERTAPIHQQYMGYRYCGNTESVPFSEWRAQLQAKGVARKGKTK